MLEDEALCSKCGKPSKKSSRYCFNCGALFEAATPQFTADARKISDISSSIPPAKLKKKLSFPYKVLIYFGIVTIINFILSLLIMRGFNLTPNSYFPIFFGVFLLSMFIVGIFWGAVKAGSRETIEAVGMCGAIVAAIFIVALATTIWIIGVLGPITGSIASAIGEKISNAIDNFFSQLFEDVEVPGFEPFLFISLFLVLSMVIIYKFHLNSKKQ